MNCGFCQSPLLPGRTRCVVCGKYSPNAGIGGTVGAGQFTDLAKAEVKPVTRIRIGDPWDQVWGPSHEPGFVNEDATLVAGFPGFGKTTMLLAFAIAFAVATKRPSYYVCSEQSSDALRRTIDRCKFKLEEGQIRVLVNKEHGAAVDKTVFKALPPGAIMLDSITDFCAQDDYKSQVALCKMYREYAREFFAPTFIIIQMNKQGDTAGLQKIQHDVDAIIELENVVEARRINRLMRDYDLDVDGELRCIIMHKNRNGPTGIDFPLVMTGTGLHGVSKLSEKSKIQGFKTGNPVADLVNERAYLYEQLEEALEDAKQIRGTIADLNERIDKESIQLHQKAEREKARAIREADRAPLPKKPPAKKAAVKKPAPKKLVKEPKRKAAKRKAKKK